MSVNIETVTALSKEYFPGSAVIRKGRGDGVVILSALPYRPFSDPGGEYMQLDAYYLASNAAHGRARELTAALHARGISAAIYGGNDYKALAAASGLASVTGMNSLTYRDGCGSRYVLAAVEVDGVEIDGLPCGGDSGARMKKYNCAACGKCVAACPCGAIATEGFLPERCMRTHMNRAVIPNTEIARSMGRRLLGCDICQRVCPMNKGQQDTDMPEELRRRLNIAAFLGSDPKSVADLGAYIGKNYANYNRLMSLAVNAAANTADPKYIPLIQKHTAAASEALAKAAQTALERLRE